MDIEKVILNQSQLYKFIKDNPILDNSRVDLHEYESCIVYNLKVNNHTVSYAIVYYNDNGVKVPYICETDPNFNYYLVWIQTNKDVQSKGHGNKLMRYILSDITHPILLLSLHQNIYLFAKLGAYLLSFADVLFCSGTNALMFYPQHKVSSFNDIKHFYHEYESGIYEYNLINDLKCNIPSSLELEMVDDEPNMTAKELNELTRKEINKLLYHIK